MVLPKLILVAQDWKGKKEYGVEDIIKSSLTSSDFADKLQLAVTALEEENQNLKQRMEVVDSKQMNNESNSIKKRKFNSSIKVVNDDFDYETIELQTMKESKEEDSIIK